MTQVKYLHIYLAIQEMATEKECSVGTCCKILHVSRAGYYKWLNGAPSKRQLTNERIAEVIEEIHEKYPDKGYRRIRDDLERDYQINVNDKRVLRICREKDIKSTIKYKNGGCTRQADNPQYLAENLLNRDFHADKPNEKWVTDVTEFKWYEGITVHKIYLSAILDLCDRRAVAYLISDHNDNQLVYGTFRKAVAENPEAHPLFHSDRGYQYTNRTFHGMIEEAGMTQSMSRVGKCIDNGPMEGFWGIIKRERYYGRRFTSRENLIAMIEEYIFYYNTKRYQRGLGVMTPMEKHEILMAA